MTTGTLTLAAPSPPCPCRIDVLMREPFVRMDGNAVVAVLNRADGVWHDNSDNRRCMKMRGGVARGDFAAAFPALADARFVTPAAVVDPAGEFDAEAVHYYLRSVRLEVSDA